MVGPGAGAEDVLLAEVTQEELDAEAEAADVDLQLEFAELEEEGSAIDGVQGPQAGRAVTARDAATAAATGRLKVELQSLRNEIEGRSGGVTARSVLAARLDLQAQAAATVSALGLAASAQEAVRASLAASMEEAVWSWLCSTAQREAAGSTDNTDSTGGGSDPEPGSRQWAHGLGVASSHAAQSSTEILQELHSTAAHNAVRGQELREHIAGLRSACASRQRVVELEAESRALLQTLASLRHSCIDQQTHGATFASGESDSPAKAEGGAQQAVARLKAEAAAMDARLQDVRRELAAAGKAFARAVPVREAEGSGPRLVAMDDDRSETAVLQKQVKVMVSTGTGTDIDDLCALD
jgi:hypothetical protein